MLTTANIKNLSETRATVYDLRLGVRLAHFSRNNFDWRAGPLKGTYITGSAGSTGSTGGTGGTGSTGSTDSTGSTGSTEERYTQHRRVTIY